MRHLARLTAVPIVGTEPPTEFRIFRQGLNDAEHDAATFDAVAAASVMADFAKHAVDIMIDLEHLSLDPEAPNFDGDARGWCKLAVRNGELWAVDVRWTPDGAARLRERRQRYISPVFFYEKAAPNRVVCLKNIAITAMPATHGALALVAARSNVTDPVGVRRNAAATMVAEVIALARSTRSIQAPKPKGSPMPPAPAGAPPSNGQPSPQFDPNAQKKLEAIAKILGVNPADIPAIQTAFNALATPVAAEEAAALRQLTSSEVALCRSKKIPFSSYLAARAGVRRVSAPTRR